MISRMLLLHALKPLSFADDTSVIILICSHSDPVVLSAVLNDALQTSDDDDDIFYLTTLTFSAKVGFNNGRVKY